LAGLVQSRGEPDLSGTIVAASNQLATAFGYPVNALQFENKTEETRARNGTNGSAIYAALSITSRDRTFAPLRLLVSKEYTLLTDDLKSKLDGTLAMASEAGSKGGLTRLDIPGLGKGYSGLGAAGPGGEEQIALLHMPAQGLDIQVRVYVSSDPPLEVNELSKAYHDALGKPGFLRGALESCVRSVAANLAEGKTTAVNEANQVSDVPASPPKDLVSQALPDSKPAQSQTRFVPFGWLAFGIMIAAALAVVLSRKK